MSRPAAQSAVASSSTLWAQASKEWVIPAKPKPGRKPKKDTAPPKESDEIQVDSKGRRVQNRAAQRAFRERKQSQLAELQARVQSYEQGEIERNVALQSISKRLKDENEELRRENAALKAELARVKSDGPDAPLDRAQEKGSKKRWRDDVAAGVLLSHAGSMPDESQSRKRFRADTDSPALTPGPLAQFAHSLTYSPSSPSLASSPDSTGASGGSYSPLPQTFTHVLPTSSVPSRSPTVFPGQSGSNDSSVFPHAASGKGFEPFDGFDCGLCNDNTPCVCRELAMQQAAAAAHEYAQQLSQTPLSAALELEAVELKPNVIAIPPAPEDASVASDRRSRTPFVTKSPSPAQTPSQAHASPALGTSILENLPAYQPPVPLRRNLSSGTAPRMTSNPIFQIRLPSPEPVDLTPPSRASGPSLVRRATTGILPLLSSRPNNEAVCSGDPTNCAACKDDDFGQAFCAALGEAASTAPPCPTCPNRGGVCVCPSSSTTGNTVAIMSLMPDSSLAAPLRPRLDHHRSVSTSALPSPLSASFPSSVTLDAPSPRPSNSETIPANEAWKQLKAHPNIAFADLSMLADVVARRTKCTGPVSVVYPPPGSFTPERGATQSPVSDAGRPPATKARTDDSSPVLLTDPHAHYREQEQQRADYGGSAWLSPASAEASVPAALAPLEDVAKTQCRRAPFREVEAAGVHEALRILDSQFGRR